MSSSRAPGIEALRPAAAPIATLQDVLDELRAFHQTVRQLLEAAAVRTTPTLSRTDRETLERLLPAVVGALGSEPFASRDLPTTSPGLRVVLRGLSVKQIGRLLARAAGVPIDGLVVVRYGKEINVTLWRVLASVTNRLETGTAIARSSSIGVGEPNG